ncbi:MAG: hypothetical protein J0H15_07800 [Xanthomonadales bacterium]|nr:hypothetical protein [Xanthomonadales bacterium]
MTLPDGATPFWDALMRNRPRDRWNTADLATAAMLARAQFDVERHEQAIAEEGDLIDGALNPRIGLVDKLGRRIVTLSRLLHVHPEATQGRAHDQGNTLALEREAAPDHDPLIPSLYIVG